MRSRLVERNRLIEAVTMADARRVAKRLFDDGAMSVARDRTTRNIA